MIASVALAIQMCGFDGENILDRLMREGDAQVFCVCDNADWGKCDDDVLWGEDVMVANNGSMKWTMVNPN